MHKLQPLSPPYSEKVSKILSRYPTISEGQYMNIFRLFANSERFCSGKGIANFMDEEAPISAREREMTILRTCSNTNCEYEWGIHSVVFRKAAAFDDEQIYSLRHGSAKDSHWTEAEAALIAVIDDLCTHKKASAENMKKFEQHYEVEQQMEIMAICGNYTTISFITNSAELELEAFASKFPAKK